MIVQENQNVRRIHVRPDTVSADIFNSVCSLEGIDDVEEYR